jgi:Kef-type K+ transport system membrane component KefB
MNDKRLKQLTAAYCLVAIAYLLLSAFYHFSNQDQLGRIGLFKLLSAIVYFAITIYAILWAIQDLCLRFKSSRSEKRILWILFLLLGGPITVTIYCWKYVWKRNGKHTTPTN